MCVVLLRRWFIFYKPGGGEEKMSTFQRCCYRHLAFFLKVRIDTGTSWRWFYRKLPLMTIFWRCRLVPNLKDKVPGLYSSYYLLHTYIIQIDIAFRIIYFFVAFPTWEFVNSSLIGILPIFCIKITLKLEYQRWPTGVIM